MDCIKCLHLEERERKKKEGKRKKERKEKERKERETNKNLFTSKPWLSFLLWQYFVKVVTHRGREEVIPSIAILLYRESMIRNFSFGLFLDSALRIFSFVWVEFISFLHKKLQL